MCIKKIITATALLALSFAGSAFALDGYAVDPQTGLRMDRYRAPVPKDVPGGTTLDTAAAASLYKTNTAIFIDVYPPKGLGPDPLDGSWVTNEKRNSIPQSIWLPEVGRGTLDEAAEDYFKRNLARLTQNDLNKAVVFYCTADCWQSWNASRRAMDWGYRAVHWFPLGTDGWLESGYELSRVQPVNFLDDTTPGASLPAMMNIYLIDQNGEELKVGTVEFASSDTDALGVNVEMDSPLFEDQFLSMRPFRCLTQAAEWFCYLPYPYELKKTVSPDNLTELEYQLLFIWKSPKNFGIDAWNGVYYKLTPNDNGSISGQLLQGDLNVLADPPEPFSHPIDLFEFIEEGAKNRLFPSLVIRP
jgi:PQQ-dependent catabolism-associated CXXCW motif protein